jgi:hypothetical protein
VSADNGVYIVKFPDGYRVCHAQAIENIDYDPVGSKERKDCLKDYFGTSKIYQSKDEAIVAAHKLYDEIMNDDFPVVEYGVRYIGEYEFFN